MGDIASGSKFGATTLWIEMRIPQCNGREDILERIHPAAVALRRHGLV